MRIKLLAFSILFNLVVVAVQIGTASAAERRGEPPELEYSVFFSEYENFFVYAPGAIKELLYGIIELKGNPKKARRFIDREVLGCPIGQELTSSCLIERFHAIQQEENVPTYFAVPVVFNKVYSYRHDRKRRAVVLHWTPEDMYPVTLAMDEFLEYINVAKDSALYRVREKIEQIQLNVVFDSKIVFLTSRSAAKNIIRQTADCDDPSSRRSRCKGRKIERGLYQVARSDLKDKLYFKLHGFQFQQNDTVGNLSLILKPEKVLINQQVFTVVHDSSH